MNIELHIWTEASAGYITRKVNISVCNLRINRPPLFRFPIILDVSNDLTTRNRALVIFFEKSREIRKR